MKVLLSVLGLFVSVMVSQAQDTGVGTYDPVIWPQFEDTFAQDFAAGSVNGTLSTGKGVHQVRTVVDTAGKAETRGGKFYLTGTTAWNANTIKYGTINRIAGTVCIANLGVDVSGVGPMFSMSTSAVISDLKEVFYFTSGNLDGRPNAVSSILWPTTLTDGNYLCGLVVRSAGMFALAKMNNIWTLLYPYYIDTTATLSPLVTTYSTDTNTLNYIYIPKSKLNIAPVLSDNFTGADGSVAGRISNGMGHPEQNGGAGLVWQAAAGWTIESNHLTNNPASTNMADLICVAQSPVADIITEGKFTASTLDSGYILNLDSFANPQNFVLVYMSGVKVMIVRVVAGIPTTVYNASTSFTYSAGAKLMIVHDRVANEYRVFYNNALITVVTLDANYNTIKNNTLFGFYGSGGQQFDDVVVWDRGSTSNAYSALDTIK